MGSLDIALHGVFSVVAANVALAQRYELLTSMPGVSFGSPFRPFKVEIFSRDCAGPPHGGPNNRDVASLFNEARDRLAPEGRL
jgi:hypothetical protein